MSIVSCDRGKTRCGDSTECLPKGQKCDGVKDCANKFDEIKI